MDDIRWRICPRRGFAKPLLGCARCGRYPCPSLTGEERDWLEHSPFTAISPRSKLLPRRVTMYLFRLFDGSITDCYEDFDPETPNFDRMENVKEVLLVGKVLEKHIKLTVKPKEERDAIRARKKREDAPGAARPAAEEPEALSGPARPRKGQD